MSYVFLRLDSMRARYAVGAAMLTIMFISSVWLTHVFITDAVSNTASNSYQRDQLLDVHREVRRNLLQVEYSLQSFLVSSDEAEAQRALSELDAAMHRVQEIDNGRWLTRNNLDEKLALLTADLRQFREYVLQLIDVRQSAEKLFPAFVPINKVMLPQSVQFNTQLDLVIDDLSTHLDQPHILKGYHQFLDIKDTWNDLVGAFRMYVASRALSLHEPVNGKTPYDAEITRHYKTLMHQLKLITQLQHREDLGLQAGPAIHEMTILAGNWYQTYQQTRVIYSSPDWRMDESLMNRKVQPLSQNVWTLLDQIERILADSSQADVMEMAEVAAQVNYVLWVRMLLAVLFVLIAFLAFEYWILRPVSRIAHALKLEAEGNEAPVLPEANTREARELIEAFHNMREQVRLRQLELEHLALHDNLTGLPNRLLLRRNLIRELSRAERDKGSFALLMIDLNKFKEINDTLGHHMGDRVLREIAPRFMAELSKKDVLARLGGDEFAVLLPNSDADRANEIVNRISRSLDADFNLDGQRLRVGSSIGVALYPQHGTNEQALLQRADVAMYLAKHKNLGFVFYSEDQEEHSVWQLSFKNELQQAIEGNLLELHYQPKVDMKTGKTIALEALLRWNHPKQGKVPADEIHVLAEKTGLIRPLAQWVIKNAIRQIADLMSVSANMMVSVNLSVWNLKDPQLCEFITRCLRECNVPASRLYLETTEHAIMSDTDRAYETMTQLSNLGVKLSIDDFGMGFSSLQYLRRMPVSELKIDKSFIMDMIIDESDAIVVRSTIDLAHNMGLQVVAEGVENQEIYEMLQILGCDTAQGYHIAYPMPARSLMAWLQDSHWGLADQSRLKIVR
ncbi:MAG: EAL domain-containing protein [Gammaproteobacteria bacterium]|nr:EAL domain-containing protein [Gammaproteobacteria bacterium]